MRWFKHHKKHTNFDDTITGTDGFDRIYDFCGNNTISVGDGGSKIITGWGNDVITAGLGFDRIFAGHGDNYIDVGDGGSFVLTGFGNDKVMTGAGSDRVHVGRGDDIVIYRSDGFGSSNARDRYFGGRGTDTLVLDVSFSEYSNDALQHDVINFLDYTEGRTCRPFYFDSLNLWVKDFEKLKLIVDGTALDTDDKPIIAEDDQATINEDAGATLMGSVLDNDDAPNGVAKLVVVDQPVAGAVTFKTSASGAPTGVYEYDPQAAFEYLGKGETTTVSFTYEVTDFDGDSDQATVTIQVTGSNDAPTLSEGKMSVGTNDVDDLIKLDLSGLADDLDSDDDPSTLIYEITGQPSDGSVLLRGSHLEFSPDSDFNDLGVGQTRDVVVEITVSDQHGATAVNDVIVTVTGENMAPVAVDDRNDGDTVIEAGYNEAGDANAAGNVLDNDYDQDLRGTLAVLAAGSGSSYSAAGVGATLQGTYGSLVIKADGRYVYTLDNDLAATEALGDDDVVTDIFTYQLTDGYDVANAASLTVTIQGTQDNRAPIAPDKSLATTENKAADDFLGISDPDQGDSIVFWVDYNSDTKGEVQFSQPISGGDVLFEFNPLSDFDHLAQGAKEVISINYWIEDLAGASDTGKVTLTVNGENDAPEMDDSKVYADEGGESVMINLAEYASDIDDGAKLSFAIISNPEHGTATINGSILTYNPGASQFDGLDYGDVADIDIGVRVTDEFNAETDATVTVKLTGTNNPPEFLVESLSEIAPEEQNKISMLLYKLDEIVSDAEDYPTDGGYPLPGADINNLAFEIMDSSHNLPIVIGPDHYIYLLAGDHFQYLAADERETVTATLKVTDTAGASDIMPLKFTITGENDEPVIGGPQRFTLYEGEQITGITFEGYDIDKNDPEIVFEIVDDPWAYGDFTQNADGSFNYSVIGDTEVEKFKKGFTDTSFFEVLAKQNGRTVGQTWIEFNIIGKNDAPTGRDYSLTLHENDLNPNAGVVLFSDLIEDVDEYGTATGRFEILRDPTLGAARQSLTYSGVSFDTVDDFKHLNSGDKLKTDFEYRYIDDAGGVATGTIDVTVLGEDNIVSARDQSYDLAENSGIVGKIQTFDVDGGYYSYYKINRDADKYDGPPESLYDEATYDPNGTFQLNADGSFVYVSSPLGDVADAGITETFDVVVVDSHGFLNGPRITLSFNVGGENNDIVASDMFVTLDEDEQNFKTPFITPFGGTPTDYTFTSDWNLRDSSGEVVAEAYLTSDNQLGIKPLEKLQYLNNGDSELLTLDYTILEDGTTIDTKTAYVTVLGQTDARVKTTAQILFEDDNQSIFAEGDAATESKTFSFGPDIDESDTITIVPGLATLDYDIELLAQLKAFLGATSGKIDSDLSFEVTFTTPNQVKAGENAIIGSSFHWVADQSVTQATGPNLFFDLDMMLEFGIDIDLNYYTGPFDGWKKFDVVTVSPPASTIKTEDHPVYGDDTERGFNLISKTATDESFDFSIPGLSEYVTFSAGLPNLDAEGSYDAATNTVTSNARGEFFSATVDLDNIATDILGAVVPPIKPALELLNPYVDLGIAQFSASIFDLDMVPAFSLVQDLEVAVNELRYDLYVEGEENPVAENFKIGDDFTYFVPEGSDDLKFSAELDLDASLTNMLSLGYDTSFVFSLLSMSVKLPAIPSIDLGPVFSETAKLPSVTSPPFVEDTFAMDFNTQSVDFFLDVA